MPDTQSRGSAVAFAMLSQFARRTETLERCELCGAEIASEHAHLVELARRKLLCACGACTVLFSAQTGRKYKRVPQRVTLLRNFQIAEAQWDGLMIPINMAFFYHNSPENRIIALYPSPAGATESLLTFESWNQIVAENPCLEEMESDVEALLVNRVGSDRGSGPEYYLLPIDLCYRLVGLLRMRWRGLSGGTEVWQDIAQFFADIRMRARTPQGGRCLI